MLGTECIREYSQAGVARQVGRVVSIDVGGESEVSIKIAKRRGVSTRVTFHGSAGKVSCTRRTVDCQQSKSLSGGCFIFSTHSFAESFAIGFAEEDCEKYNKSNTVKFTLCSSSSEGERVTAIVEYFVKNI